MTANVRVTKATLMPIKSMIIPMKKGNIMFGNAITVYSMLNCVSLMCSYSMRELCNAWGLLKAYILANTTMDSKKRMRKRIGPLRYGI